MNSLTDAYKIVTHELFIAVSIESLLKIIIKRAFLICHMTPELDAFQIRILNHSLLNLARMTIHYTIIYQNSFALFCVPWRHNFKVSEWTESGGFWTLGSSTVYQLLISAGISDKYWHFKNSNLILIKYTSDGPNLVSRN